MNYYISDLHFRDQRIFDLTNKPFKDIYEFENYVIERWNQKVTDEDKVYVIGDIGKEKDVESYNIYSKLKGRKYLIIGNHDVFDKKLISNLKIFKKINGWSKILDSGRIVTLSHFPLLDWIHPEKENSYHIYGHIHNKVLPEIKQYYRDKRAYNASCDVVGFEPRTLDELIELKEKNKNEPYIN